MPNTVPSTDWEFRTVNHVTGEMHMFAADGRNLSVEAGADDPGEFAPQTAVNAVIAYVILKYTYTPPRHEWQRDSITADPAWRGWCNMTPVVTDVAPASDPLCPGDVWWVEVQYNSSGSRASFGVDRNNVPQCYQD
jgi:hypothetical protein